MGEAKERPTDPHLSFRDQSFLRHEEHPEHGDRGPSAGLPLTNACGHDVGRARHCTPHQGMLPGRF